MPEVPDEHDERALIERCRAGDDSAFGELVDCYKNLVYGLVYRMVSDRSRVDDLAQEVFLKVYRGLPYFRGEARLSTWIFRIVQNVCAAARSRRPPTSRSIRRKVPAGAYEPGGNRRCVWRSGTARPSRKGDRPAARAPAPAHRGALSGGRAGPDAGGIMNIPLGTVKTHLYRAKKRLRELLDT